MIPIGFDKTVLLRVTAGDEALALEMVQLLMNDLPHQREQILAASARGSRHELARLAHSLAGGAAYCGALELKRRCLELENCSLDTHASEVGARKTRYSTKSKDCSQQTLTRKHNELRARLNLVTRYSTQWRTTTHPRARPRPGSSPFGSPPD